MSTINHDTSNTDDAGTTGAVARAGRELDVSSAARIALYATRPSTDAEWATRAEILALHHAREAGWWGVLLHGAQQDLDVAQIYRTAVVIARAHARERARYWRESAAEWRARAEQRPTSDAAGALSNWAQLGVTA